MLLPVRIKLVVAGFAAVWILSTSTLRAGENPDTEPALRVVVWDERQKEQKQAYGDQFLGDAIAEYLSKQPDLKVRSVGQAEFNDLPTIEKLVSECDVIIWWGHLQHTQISPEVGKMIARRIKEGKLSLVALHSAHWAVPFVEAMNERTRLDAEAAFSSEPGKVEFEYIPTPPIARMFLSLPQMRQMVRTPYYDARKFPDETTRIKVYLPWCVFPSFRHDGKPSQVLTRLPDHPIARGLPERFTIEQTEMYDEPFDVPAPDAVVFEERWEGGEWFRSGCVWQIGLGRVFYFRPGHETYPVFKQPWPLKIIENAVRWMGQEQGANPPSSR